VGMPEKIRDTIKLYGFLGLDPKRDFLTYRGKPLTGASPFTAILIAALVFCGLWLFVGFLYLMTYCFPSEWNWPLGLTSMGIGGAIGAAVGWMLGRIESQNENRSSPTVVAIAIGLLGVLGGFMVMGLINAAFDRSEPTYRPIAIENHWQKTHKLMFREYEIEYTEFGKGKSEKSHVTVDDLFRLGSAKLGAKEIRQGALGLEWVKGFHPCEWIQTSESTSPQDEVRAVTVDSRKWMLVEMRRLGMQFGEGVFKFLDDKERRPLKVVPMLLLPDGTYVSIPDELVDRAKQQLQRDLN
jgi:hypothetical protein